MSDLLIPDISEHNPLVNWQVFAGPIIVRAHNGWRPDYHFAANAAGAMWQPWWSAYQYLPASVDPAAAARLLLDTIGSRRPNAMILDLEEGEGDQQPRQHAWLAVMAGDPATDWTYSGDYFARAHNLDQLEWVAAYSNREPTRAHELWQDTDARYVPGIGVADGSRYHGTLDQLIAATNNDNGGQSEVTDDDLTRIAGVVRLQATAAAQDALRSMFGTAGQPSADPAFQWTYVAMLADAAAAAVVKASPAGASIDPAVVAAAVVAAMPSPVHLAGHLDLTPVPNP